jgi:CRISPR-associated protein Cas6
MYWQEEHSSKVYVVPGDVADLSFAIRGSVLPVDHAYALAEAIRQVLPWITEEGAGIHEIHVADSGNGWYRPEGSSGQLLHLSRRTKLTLRLARERLESARSLSGRVLDVAGHRLEVGESTARPLSPFPTLFARHVVALGGDDEAQFLDHAASMLRENGLPVRKLLCGRSSRIETASGSLLTRSLMVADLDPPDSVRLQQRGLGPKRYLGCGLFIPHKGIRPVPRAESD